MYKDKVKKSTYKIIILEELQKEFSISDNVIESLEEECAKVAIKVEEV